MSKRPYITKEDIKEIKNSPVSLDVNVDLYKILDELYLITKETPNSTEIPDEKIDYGSIPNILKVFPYAESASLHDITSITIDTSNMEKYGYLTNENKDFKNDNILVLTLIDSNGGTLVGDLSRLSKYGDLITIYNTINTLNTSNAINKLTLSGDKLTLTKNYSRDYILFYKDRDTNRTLHTNTRKFIHSIWEPKITNNKSGIDATKDLSGRSKKKEGIPVDNNTIDAYPFIVGDGDCENLNIILMVRNIPVLMEKRKIKSNYYIFMYPEWLLSYSETYSHLSDSKAYLIGYNDTIILSNTISTEFQTLSGKIFKDPDPENPKPKYGTLNYININGGN